MHRVAIIGAGPFGMFAAAELLRNRDVLVDVFDRLPDPVRPETRFRAVSWGRRACTAIADWLNYP